MLQVISQIWHRQQSIIDAIRKKTIVSVPVNNLNLLVDTRDTGVGYILYRRGEYEPAETQWLQRTVRPGMTVIDIGAHVGYFTTLIARLVGPTGRVIAFEPDPYNFWLLSRNIRRNQLQNVHLVRQALGAERGKAQLYRSPINHGDHRLIPDHEHGRAISVSVTTLDDARAVISGLAVDVIKMDVQGYEPFVMAGATQTINHSRDLKIMTEFWPYGLEQSGSSAPRYFDDVIKLGFNAAVLDSKAVIPINSWPELQQRISNLDAHHPQVFTNLILSR